MHRPAQRVAPGRARAYHAGMKSSRSSESADTSQA